MRFFLQSIKRIFNLKESIFLPCILLLQLLIHVQYMRLPAVGNHVWRQVNTLAVARNYYEEDMRIWLPRIDKRYHFSGVTGPQFPSYEYGLACIYKVFGYSEVAHRWWSLLLSCLALWGMYRLAFTFIRKRLFASLAAFALLSIPEFYYHSINAVPDLLALAAMLWGWYFARKWLQSWDLRSCIAATLLLSLAGVTKLLFLVCGVPIALEFLQRRRYLEMRYTIAAFVMLLMVISSAYAWYTYAHWLTFKDWLNEFVHDVRAPASVGDFFGILTNNLLRDVPETWVGYGLMPSFLLGAFWFFRNKRHWVLGLASLFAALAVYIPLQEQYKQHGYYFLALCPFVVLLVAYGYMKMADSRWRPLLLVLVLAPVWAWARIKGNWEPKHWRVPQQMVTSVFAEKARKLSDTSIRWIVGPDQTGCVYFYYLHAKGFPWYNMQEGTEIFTRFRNWGAKGIITDQKEALFARTKDSLNLEFLDSTGGFYWYRIQPSKH